ncbi:MAG: hypothetical protein MUC60_19090 [Oscillatoria sp. Prado101]|nr:hypothetical protein [Oscillatoria sp. Prado101]
MAHGAVGDQASGMCLPAVALTVYAKEEDRRQALLAGHQSHVTAAGAARGVGWGGGFCCLSFWKG